jgi:hypothetical protein
MLKKVSLSSGFLDFAIVEAEIYAKLFSPAGLQDPPGVRVAHAKSLAMKLHRIQTSLKVRLTHFAPLSPNILSQSNGDDSKHDSKTKNAAMSLDIVMFCLLTVVYRLLPPEAPTPHPLQCCDECIDAARNALSSLVEVGERRRIHEPVGWQMFLNQYAFPISHV